jgi:formylglycine-generating enzyme required for sulfatase activity
VDCFPTIVDCVGLRSHPDDRDLPGSPLLDIVSGVAPHRTVMSEYHAAGAATGAFMIRKGKFKYVYYVGMLAQLFDLEVDPYERRNLAQEAGYSGLVADCDVALRKVVDPEAADALARRDQAEKIQELGGRDKILAMGLVGCCSGLHRSGTNGVTAAHQRREFPKRFVVLRGGRFRMGTDQSPLPNDGEGPSRLIDVKPFAIDPYAVTNSWFAEFVAATGYVTEAERFGWSLVFRNLAAQHEGMSGDAPSWWLRVEGACWKNPEGASSNIAARADHPVVHVSWNDAAAFAGWAGGRLPTEAEWEFAAQGGLKGSRFPWGDEEPNDDAFPSCNIWRGEFPDGHLHIQKMGTAAVGAFAPNGYGLFNMVGNTWEWCADAFRIRSLTRVAKKRNAVASAEGERVLKGGSYLCHRSYCYRYRIAARSGAGSSSSAGHVGFRVVFDGPGLV